MDILETSFGDLKPIWYNAVNETVYKCTFIRHSCDRDTIEDLVDRFTGKEV